MTGLHAGTMERCAGIRWIVCTALAVLMANPATSPAQSAATLVVQSSANLRALPSSAGVIIRTLRVGDTAMLLSAPSRTTTTCTL